MRLFRRKSDRVPTTPCLIKLSAPLDSARNIGDAAGSLTAQESEEMPGPKESSALASEGSTGTQIPRPNRLNLNGIGTNRAPEVSSPKTPIRKGKSSFICSKFSQSNPSQRFGLNNNQAQYELRSLEFVILIETLC